jgi:hypothetical protein
MSNQFGRILKVPVVNSLKVLQKVELNRGQRQDNIVNIRESNPARIVSRTFGSFPRCT